MDHARRPLTRKLLALLLAPTIACMTGLGLVTTEQRRSDLLAEAARELDDHAAVLRATLPPLAAALDSASLVALADTMAERQRVHGIALYDRDGRAIVRSSLLRAEAAGVEALARQALAARRDARAELRVGEADALVQVALVQNSPAVGAIVVSHDLAPVRAIHRAGVVRVSVAGALLAAAMAAVALWLSRSIARAVGELVHGAEQIAAGDVAVRLPESGALELARAARAFNAMTDSLARARARLDAERAARRELEWRVQHAQALAIVGEVAASLAHDIGSPLNVILGTARLGAQDPATPDELRAQLAAIAAQCERITRIVERLMAVARPAPDASGTAAQPAGLADVVREAAAFLEPDCRRHAIAARVEIARDAPARVGLGRDELLQLLVNLGVNAIQAQPAGGVLVFAAGAAPAQAAGGGTRAWIEVRDAGPGVPVEARAKVFEPFFTTRRERGGTGLGLVVSARIARRAGGTLEVGVAPEGGAAFRVTLPSA